MKAIRIPADPKQPISTIDVRSNFEALAAAIGSGCEYIERFRCPLTPELGLVGVVDEEGQYSTKQAPNERAWALYPVPGYHLKGDVLVLAEGNTPDGVDFIDMPDERKALLAVINLVAGVDRA
jgi:hypothetical protein